MTQDNEARPAVKALTWRHYPDAFPPMWVSQNAAFGNYSIEEAAGSDTPRYDVLNPTMGLMVNCDDLPDAKAAAQADYERRILSALEAAPEPTPASGEDLAVYWKGAFERMATRNIRLNNALTKIRDQHIPDQPATHGGTEYDWVVGQYANLRRIANEVVEG